VSKSVQVARELDEAIVRLTARTPPAGWQAFGRALLALDRPADALAAFDRVPGPGGWLQVAECLYELRRWGDGDAVLRAGLADLLPAAGSDPAAADRCRAGFDDLARSGQARGDYAAA
jgi:hypothetical protein